LARGGRVFKVRQTKRIQDDTFTNIAHMSDLTYFVVVPTPEIKNTWQSIVLSRALINPVLLSKRKLVKLMIHVKICIQDAPSGRIWESVRRIPGT